MAIEKALVIGGGIGGLCAAIALRQKGVDVDLIEKSKAGAVWGIGIIHQTNAVRAEAALGVADKVLEQGEWRCNVQRLEELKEVWLYLTDAGTNAGLMPLSDELMYIWCTSNEKTSDWKNQADIPREMREIVGNVGGIYGQMRDRYLTDDASVVYRPFEYVDLPRPWHKESVVLIGDASHASTAHLAQGAAMAMEDALVVADEVAGGGCAPDCLQRWEERRYARCKWMADTSLKICRHEQGLLDEPDFNVLGTMIEGRKRAMASI